MGLFAGTKWDVPSRCEKCGELEADCRCAPDESGKREWLAPEKQTARIGIEKRKKGKIVTVICGLAPDQTDVDSLIVHLKNACGAGGTIDEAQLIIQGDHAERIQSILLEIGYRVKLSK